MSAEATGWVWKYSPYTGAQLLVHLAIADVVNDANDNEFWMSRSNLAAKAKVSRSTVNEALGDMLDRRLLTMLESGADQRRPSRFRFEMSTSATTGLARPTTDLGDDRGLGRPPTVTGPATGLALGQPARVTRPISTNSLGRSPRAIPKEITQEPKAASQFENADPNCIRCHGEGRLWSAGPGAFIPCSCTAPRPLEVVS